MKTPSKPIIALIATVIFGIGFVFGMEFKAYQIRGAIGKAFSGSSSAPSPTPESVVETAKKESIVINKAIGDEIALATGIIQINKAEEVQTIGTKYSAPKVAKEGTKFVIVNLDVTNTTKSEFTFFPDDVFLLVDEQQREFRVYDESIGALDNYLNVRKLSPSVKETGNIMYEIPSDATSYSLVTSKGGTNELYIIKLK